EVAARGVLVDVVGVVLDLEAGLGDAGRVREREVALVRERLRRHDGDLAWPALRVVVEGVLAFHECGCGARQDLARAGRARPRGPTTGAKPFMTSSKQSECPPIPTTCPISCVTSDWKCCARVSPAIVSAASDTRSGSTATSTFTCPPPPSTKGSTGATGGSLHS